MTKILDSAYIFEKIKEFIPLQQALIKQLIKEYPDAYDTDSILQFPKSGHVTINATKWAFKKHGSGFGFTNSKNGWLIEAHNYISKPEYFDAWRLTCLIESQIGQEINEPNLWPLFEELNKQGFIEKCFDKMWRIKSTAG